MKFKTLSLAAAVAALCAGHQVVLANDGVEIKYSGFGTLGFVSSNNDSSSQFRNGFSQHTGASSSDYDLGVDSRLGLQANVKFNDTFSAVGQVLAHRTQGEFAPHVEWLFGQAKLADGVDLRVGRLVLPVFMVSDSRYVGYANHWLRAPQEAYGFYGPTSFDGVQGVIKQNFADTNFTLQLSAGSARGESFNGGSVSTAKYNTLYSAALSAERGNWLARVSYTEGTDTDFSVPPLPLINGKDKFMGMGLQYDNGQWIVMSEYVTRRWTSEGANAAYNKAFDSNGYYISAGYRMGTLTPYVSTGTFKPKGFFFSGPNYAINGRTNAVGLRWDFMPNVAFKTQIEQVKGAPGAQTMVLNSATFDPHKTIRAFSAVLDFVF